MNLPELLLFALVAWTIIGAVGVAISLHRQDRAKGRRHLGWIAGVWVVYLGTVLATSLFQPQKIVAIGQDQCFDDMCFAVTGVEDVPGFLIRDGSRLIRVSLRVTNHARGKTQSERLIQAYLLDGQGRRWRESTGISGVRLTAAIPPRGSVLSKPVFKVAKDASPLGLVLTHGWKQPGVLVIGDSDSLLHKPAVVAFEQ